MINILFLFLLLACISLPIYGMVAYSLKQYGLFPRNTHIPKKTFVMVETSASVQSASSVVCSLYKRPQAFAYGDSDTRATFKAVCA